MTAESFPGISRLRYPLTAHALSSGIGGEQPADCPLLCRRVAKLGSFFGWMGSGAEGSGSHPAGENRGDSLIGFVL